MDIARLETLEAHIVSLVQAYACTKEKNKQLCQNVQELEDALLVQEQELARLRPEQKELIALRDVMQTLQRERGVIRQKLEQMLTTIEWIESHTWSSSDTKS
jgi:DNA integrity scanning protein DisA with diadenylate cyclase activity